MRPNDLILSVINDFMAFGLDEFRLVIIIH